MVDLLAPRRSAHASIRGYLYQALLGVERWLRLGTEGETADAILCEGDDDLDRLIRDGIATSEQIKDYSGPIGIGDRVVRETLARFLVSWTTLRRRDETRRFVFTTTAPRRPPRTGPDILRLWHDPEHRDEVVQGIRERTQSLKDDAAAVETALAWLDEHGAWDDFLAAVDWRFETPHFAGTRAEIARHLADRGLDPQLHDTLTDRILAHVLEVSTHDKPEDRILTEPDLTELLELTEHDLAAWAATPRAIQLRRTLDETAALRPLLTPGHAELPSNAPPSKLLTARYEVVPFEEAGREQEIARLTEWCRSSDPASVLLLHGPGGTGKTRLLIEWCRRLRHQGWHAGFLDPEAEFSALEPLFDGVAPRLVVIDYGETRPALVGNFLHRLARQHETGGPKIRLALLARTSGAWWQQVQREDPAIEDLVLTSPPAIGISALTPRPEERPAVVARAASAFAAALELRAPEHAADADYSHERYERALYLQVDALLQVLDGEDHGDDSPLARILDHERRAWRRALQASPTTGAPVPSRLLRAAARTVAALTLVQGAVARPEARTLVRIAAPSASAETGEDLCDLLHRLYPGAENRFIAPLEPDLLGEELLRQVLADDPTLFDDVLDTATARQTHDAWVVVGRLLLAPTSPVVIAEQVVNRIGYERYLPIPQLEAVVNATKRALAERDATASEPDPAHLEKRVKLFNNLGNRLAALGDLQSAFKANNEAVEILRQLADEQPEDYLPKLAIGLNNLSNRFAELGRIEDSVRTIEEAVEIRRRLVDEDRGQHLPGLANALKNFGLRLTDLDRLDQALNAIREAIDIYQHLDREHLESYFLHLAECFDNLGICLHALGRHDDAVHAGEQAVYRYRELARERPDPFLRELAPRLSNLGRHLATAGRLNEALDASEEAVRILSPFFWQSQAAVASDMRASVDNYYKACERTHTTPDQALLAPIEEALSLLDDEEPTEA